MGDFQAHTSKCSEGHQQQKNVIYGFPKDILSKGQKPKGGMGGVHCIVLDLEHRRIRIDTLLYTKYTVPTLHRQSETLVHSNLTNQ